jgi:hypothetical protein
MVDEGEAVIRRTRKLGHVPNDRLQEMEEWNFYFEKSLAFSRAKMEAEKAKEAMRATIKDGLVKIKKIEPHDEIDFVVDREDASITIFQVLSKTRGRTKSEDLSSLFKQSEPHRPSSPRENESTKPLLPGPSQAGQPPVAFQRRSTIRRPAT